jgi:DNA-binding XRE family transcriptional regulator
MRHTPAISRNARMAAELLGLEIARARRERRWSQAELAERAGIARSTLHNLESGDPAVSMGTAFEVATLVGLSLFTTEQDRLGDLVARARDQLALLPAKVRPRTEVDNAF